MKPDPTPERVDAEALAAHIGRVAGPCADDYADAILALARERDHYRGEAHEQARLLGMGSEREARLMAERDDQARLAMEYHRSYSETVLERDEALSLLTEAADEVANMLCVRAIREASGPRNVEYAEGVIQRARALLARHGKEAAR